MSATGRTRPRERGVGRRATRPRLSPPSGYNDREIARITAMRTPVGACPTCDRTIYEHPGYCSMCEWDEAGR